MPGPQEVLEALRRVKYPGYTRDIVSFGMVKDIQVSSSGTAVQLAPSTADEEVVRQIEEAVRATVTAIPGVAGPVTVIRQSAPQPQARRGPQPIPGVETVLAVAERRAALHRELLDRFPRELARLHVSVLPPAHGRERHAERLGEPLLGEADLPAPRPDDPASLCRRTSYFSCSMWRHASKDGSNPGATAHFLA